MKYLSISILMTIIAMILLSIFSLGFNKSEEKSISHYFYSQSVIQTIYSLLFPYGALIIPNIDIVDKIRTLSDDSLVSINHIIFIVSVIIYRFKLFKYFKIPEIFIMALTFFNGFTWLLGSLKIILRISTDIFVFIMNSPEGNNLEPKIPLIPEMLAKPLGLLFTPYAYKLRNIFYTVFFSFMFLSSIVSALGFKLFKKNIFLFISYIFFITAISNLLKTFVINKIISFRRGEDVSLSASEMKSQISSLLFSNSYPIVLPNRSVFKSFFIPIRFASLKDQFELSFKTLFSFVVNITSYYNIVGKPLDLDLQTFYFGFVGLFSFYPLSFNYSGSIIINMMWEKHLYPVTLSHRPRKSHNFLILFVLNTLSYVLLYYTYHKLVSFLPIFIKILVIQLIGISLIASYIPELRVVSRKEFLTLTFLFLLKTKFSDFVVLLITIAIEFSFRKNMNIFYFLNFKTNRDMNPNV